MAAKLAVTERGNPANPAILFLHGFLGAGSDWFEVADALSDRHSCLLVDLPGHGASVAAPPELFPMAACAEALIAELDRQAIATCSLCAYSMGGRLAYYLLTHFPDRFSRALIESGTPGLQAEPERAARRKHDESIARRIEREGMGPFLIFWYQQPLFASLAKQPDRLRSLINERFDNDPAAMARSLRAMGTGSMPDLWPLVSRITKPLLLVTGEYDAKFQAIAERTVDLCGSAEHHILRGCGHAAHIESPAAFSKLAQQFFS